MRHPNLRRLLPILFLAAAAGCSSSQADPAALRSLTREPAPEGCDLRYVAQGLCATLSWASPPAVDATGSFTLRFWNEADGASGPSVDPGFTVFAKLWMPSMGHGSSPVTVAQLADGAGAPVTGEYEATGAYFSMGGAWEVWVQLRRGADVVERAKIDLEL